jgi:multiple sugar transport system substrate-binding protein
MRRITFSFVFAAMFVIGGLALGQQTVTLLFWPGPESEAMQQVIDAYNAGQGQEDGVEVEQLLFSRQGFFDKELADLSAGSTEFDLNLVTTYTLGRYAPYLEPLGQYVTGDPASDFIPAAIDSLTFDDQIFGVPTDVSLHFLFFRQDLIDQLMEDEAWQETYGDISEERLGERLQPKAPADWTWDDYIATSLFFTRSINPDSPTQFGTVLQLRNLIFNIMIWQSTLVSNGGNWLDEDGNVIIDSDAAARGLEIYQTIIDAGATPPGSINYEFAEANEAFRNGQAASMLQWNAAYSTLTNPEESPQVADQVGIAPPPAGPEGHRTHVHSLGIGMNAASENKEAAGHFVDYLFTEEAMAIYAEAGGSPPVVEVLNAMADDRPDFARLAQYLDDYAFVVNGGTASYAVPVYEVLAEEFSAVWSGQKSIEQALDDAQSRMQETVSR